ncbi:hypothetical protein DSO57_1012721 [Entomophthora muscae]|uniref:Uncharacterized protein n=1 Tax=Entomophthora muscae TaxID=34485 RepID=A0ACC2T5V2_9FUNG|nr:hypothetical protein DSO57_1012721 [Entomophthora muscae]
MSFEKVKGVEINNTDICKVPSAHVRYHIVVTAEVKSWSVWKRYSDFDRLHQKLSKLGGEHTPPPVSLPPKAGWFTCVSYYDEVFVEGRQLDLEAYLRSIITCDDTRWVSSNEFIQFLDVPAARSSLGDTGESISSEGWLQELQSCQSVVREIRASLIQRENAFQKNNLNHAHQLTAQARKQTTALNSRLTRLERALNKLNQTTYLTSGELLRRRDLLAQVFNGQSLLTKLVNKTMPSESNNDSHLNTDRAELLAAQKPKSRRVFGKAPSETAETRALDNDGLLQLQKSKMEEQDQYLSQFSSILARQHQIGTHIGQELEVHNQLLKDLDTSVACTDTNIKATAHNVRKIS